MIISLTGTPGTGKTSISRKLKKNNINIIHLNDIIAKNKNIYEIDNKRNTKIVEISKLNKIIRNEINIGFLTIIEGHLSHLLNTIDKVIILRCHPFELKNRLLKKRWNQNKIKENIESEILDIILCECVSNYSINDIFEIDTTGKNINDISINIFNIIKNNFKNNNNFRIGKIDWSDEILNI